LKLAGLRATLLLGGSAILMLAGGRALADGRYVVKSGDTLTSIARAHSISLHVLAQANRVGDHLKVRQTLVIPGRTNRSARHFGRQPSASPSGRYVVKPGDTLSSIAKRVGVSVAALARQNRAGDKLSVGQVLSIPGPHREAAIRVASAPKKAHPIPPTPRPKHHPSKAPQAVAQPSNTYVVARGDTLYSIARRHKIPVQALIAANGHTERIRVGQRLAIPGTGTSTVEASSAPRQPSAMVRRRGRTEVRPAPEDLDRAPVSDEERTEDAAWGTHAHDGQPSTDSSTRERLVRTALAFRGGHYVRGGSSPHGFDCSGFTSYVYRKAAGIKLPRTSSGQFTVGSRVSTAELAPGDLVFFTRGGRVGHVGIYIGGGEFIHASNYKRGVRIDSIYRGSYVRRLVGARRMLPSR